MANDKTRRAHVKRIYKTEVSASGVTINEDIWFDVLRIDRILVSYSGLDSGKTGLVSGFNFNWRDSPWDEVPVGDIQNEKGNASRKYQKLKITNPDSEDQTNELFIVNKAKITTRGALQPGDDRGGTHQAVNWVFNNAPRNSSDLPASVRKFSAMKVVNNDLNGLDMSREGSAKGIVNWEIYRKALQEGDTDDGQWVGVELPKNFKINYGPDAAGKIGQGITYQLTGNFTLEELLNADNERVFLPMDPDARDSKDKLIPQRLDPLEFIVNVSWGAAVKFDEAPEKKTDKPAKMYHKLNMADTDKLSLAMWVRVPQTAFDKLKKDANDNGKPEEAEEGRGSWITLLEFGIPGTTVDSGQRDPFNPSEGIYPSLSATSEFVRSRIDVRADRTRVIFTGPKYTQNTYACSIFPVDEILEASFSTIVDSQAGSYTPMLVFAGDFPEEWQAAVRIEVKMPSLSQGWLQVYHDTLDLVPGSAVPPLPPVGGWFVNDPYLTVLGDTPTNVPAGTNVDFKVHVSNVPTTPYTDQMQMGIRYSALPHGTQAYFQGQQFNGPGLRDDISNFVAPDKGLKDQNSFVPDAWNCILVSVDVSDMVVVRHGTVRNTGGFNQIVVDYPTFEQLNKLTMFVNNVDWTPKYAARQRSDFLTPPPERPFYEYVETTFETGNMLPTRFPNNGDEASGPGPKYEVEGVVHYSANGPSPFLWDSQWATDSVPYKVSTNQCNIRGADAVVDMSVEPWKVALKDNLLGIPSQPWTGPASEKKAHDTKGLIEYGPVMIWVDKFIDFRDENIRERFLNLETKEIVSPNKTWELADHAVASLGKPDYFFNGGPGSFVTNRGKSDPVLSASSTEDERKQRKFTVQGKPVSYSPAPKIAGKVIKDTPP